MFAKRRFKWSLPKALTSVVILALSSLMLAAAEDPVVSSKDRPQSRASAKPSQNRQSTVTRGKERTRTARTATRRSSRHHSKPHRYGPRRYGYYPYYPYYRPYYYYGYYSNYYRFLPNTYGAINIKVKPKKAKVYVDGHYVGTAGKFDGWPQKLWLNEGSYELIFYLEGHKTVRKEVQVVPRNSLRLEMHMENGTPIEVKDLSKPLHKREMSREALRSRYSKDRDRGKPAPRRRDLREKDTKTPRDLDLRENPGGFKLAVFPEDASVYLDDQFLGTGGEVTAREGRILIDPGKHRLQVIRPGFREQVTEFEVAPGKTVELDISLEKDH